jgi:peptidoglycan/xylan/chitin deacetylase (PgdA/CDA1 family)
MVVSIDTEMAWGLAHKRGAGQRPGDAAARGDFDDERRVVDEALRVFDRHGIPATWAIVGHLFLDRCSPGPDGRPHPELARPAYPWLDEDWYAVDPLSTLAGEPAFYGRDLVERILAASAGHEVASHGFSHVMIGDDGCPAEVFDAELSASAAAAGELGVDLRSFVFPRNSIGHLGRLGAHGFRSYRGGRAVPPFAGRSGRARQALRAVDRVRPLAGSAARPAWDPAGVWNVPQTYLFAPGTQRTRLPVGLWTRRPLARLRQAARHRALFHLWFHPYNLTAAPERALDALDRVCVEAARLRDRGLLAPLTMGGLADELERARQSQGGLTTSSSRSVT